jgi:hypothetical protein
MDGHHFGCVTKQAPKKHRVNIIIYHVMLKQGVCQIVALPFTLKIKYLKAKEELWKLKYFNVPKYNLQKNPLKENKILQDIITL